METPLTQGAPPDLLRILVVTDNHLGHKERDPVRANDSFDVFEEILQLAGALQVDLILHCGDLFDHHKPSRATLYKTLLLLRKHCLAATRRETFRVLNKATRQHVFKFHAANFERPGVAIILPILGIHGNHGPVVRHKWKTPVL